MRNAFSLLLAVLCLFACSPVKSVTPVPAGASQAAASVSAGNSHQNNLITITSPVQATSAAVATGKVVFEGSHNLFDIMAQHAATFEQGYDVVIIKGDGILFRFYNTALLDFNASGADSLVLIGNNLKYVMATASTPAVKTPPSRIDTVFLKTQPLPVAAFTQGLEPGSFGHILVSNLLKRIKAGDREAYFELGEVYNFGKEGVPIHTAKAVFLYEHAAAKGDVGAIRRLGDIWYNGTFDHEPHKAKGLFYYSVGARLGDAYCQHELKGK